MAQDGMAHSPQRSRLLGEALEKSVIAFAIVDREGCFVYANEAYLRMWGYDRLEEIVGTPASAHCADPTIPEAALATVRLQGTHTIEFVAKRRDGSVFDAQMSIQRTTDEQDREVFVGTAVDITTRKWVTSALRESQRQLGHFVEQAPIAIAMFDREMRYLAASRRWAAEFDRGYADLVGRSHYDVHPDLPVWWRGVHARCLAGETISNDHDFWERADGIRQWIRWAALPWREDTGEIGGIIISSEDVTARMEAEIALRHSEEKFARAFRISPDAITINRVADGVFLEVNQGFCELTGYNVDEVVGHSPLEFGLWADDADRERLLDRLRESGEVLNLETQFRIRDGSVKIALLSARFLDVDDQFCILAIARDISAYRSLEAQLHQAQKMDAIGQLAGGIAHDFNNMLGVIQGFATLIQEGLPADDPLGEHVRTIITAARRSADLTRQLLTFASRQIATPVPLDLNVSLQAMRTMLEHLIGENITLRLSLAEDLWNVKIDASQVDQLITNLASNARDAIDDVGTITIETAKVTIDPQASQESVQHVAGEYVRLVVRDTGRGMDEATRARVFEPFFTTKPLGAGTGLGLATVFGIVKQNDGFIDVSSTPGGGTTFAIHLPRHLGEVAPAGEPAASPARPQGTETVLVVEDEPQLLRFVSMALARQGYRVLTARSPEDAIRLCEQESHRIDLVLTDVIMPGMNGYQLAERLKQACPQLAAVFMSGYAADVLAQRGILDGSINFLQKPFTLDALARLVRDVLNGGP